MESDGTEPKPISDQAGAADFTPVDDSDDEYDQFGRGYECDLGVWMREDVAFRRTYEARTLNAGGDVFGGGDFFFTVEWVAGEWYSRVAGLDDVKGANDRLGPFDSEVEAYSAVAARLLAYVVLVSGGTSWTSSPLAQALRPQ